MLKTNTHTEVQVLTSTVRVVSSARDLGVVIDSRLTMAEYVRLTVAQLTIICDRSDPQYSR